MNRQALKKLKPSQKIKYWNIAVGDSVKILNGPQKGQIGQVQECLKDQNKVIVNGINIIKKMLPVFVQKSANLDTQKFEYASPIHYSNVQLIGEIPEATNPGGPKRKVEIKRVHRGKLFYNRDKKLLTWRRWVPGEDVFLPWPRNEKTKLKGPMDTQESDLRASTFVESLEEPPIPLEVQHELRNKYSRLRPRTDQIDLDDLDIEEVDGVETVAKPTQQRNPRGSAILKGMTPETIDMLAGAMRKHSSSQI